MIARCGHQQMKNAEACIVEIIGENNLDHFFVGTQDTDMRKKFQERHARSEKLMKENRMQVMLNSDGEIENMDEETHAERHARTVALAQAAIARLEALENDYTGMETVEAVDDDESSLEDDGIRFQVKENVL
ncbi:hypothetical protein DKX38_011922 [Salix brachista]|uniref:Uncharacterized protein n=1 Tax=Salix brachista TaxID=2182728 RepID=A0A5N5M2W8_9ROSI|nr:hypothetical protein DKX38_011922 [Salix brachista]